MDNLTRIENLVNAYAGGNHRVFANMLGVSYQTVTNWKRPDRTPDYLLIYEKCENLSGDWLLSGEGELFRQPTRSQTVSDKGKQAMAAVIRDINVNAKDSSQAQKIALLEQILEEKERLIQILLSQRNSEETAK